MIAQKFQIIRLFKKKSNNKNPLPTIYSNFKMQFDKINQNNITLKTLPRIKEI